MSVVFNESTKKRLILSKGTLHDNTPFYTNEIKLKDIVLLKHQLQTINAMHELETNKKKLNNDEYLVSEIGILANKVGSGKSICVLGAISIQNTLHSQAFVNYHFGELVFVMNQNKYVNMNKSNLLVVPHHLIKPVWEEYIVKYTYLSYYVVKQCDFPINFQILNNYDIIICGARYYNMLMKTSNHVCWNRVIFDEADTINIPACVKPNTRFTWFVTSSIKNLLFSNGYYLKYDGEITKVLTKGIPRKGFIKNTFRSLESNNANYIIEHIVVKLNDEYINTFLNLPGIKEEVHVCKNLYYLNVLSNILPDNILSLLHGNDIESALEIMGCPVDTKENVISFVSRELHFKKQNMENKLNYLQHMEISNHEYSVHVNHKIQKAEKKINEITKRLVNVRQKINEMNKDTFETFCPICHDYHNSAVLFSCCLNVYCDQCVKDILYHKLETCPLCREPITIEKIVKPVLKQIGSKDNQLINLLKNERSNSVIIFGLYEQSLSHISSILKENKFQFKKLHGKNISKYLLWFHEKKIKIMLINCSLYGHGLNLTCADTIVFYQSVNNELKTQMIGRSYRFGRTTPLHIHYLYYENEIK